MKKYVAILLTLALTLAMVVLPVGAASFTATSSLAEDTLTVSGTGASGLVSILILDEIQSADTLSSSNMPTMIEATLADTSGTYTMPIILSAGLTTGRYKVYVVNGANNWTSAPFAYVNPGELASLSSNINLATNDEEIKTLLEPFQIVLQMPDLDFTAEYLFKIRPAAGYSQDSLNKELQRSAALYLLSQGADVETLTPYKDYLADAELGIDCFEQYKNLGDSAKSDYSSKVAVMDLKTITALEDVYGVGVVSSTIHAESWQNLRESLLGGETANDFFTKKIADGTKYDDLKYPETVFQELYRQKSSLSDINALKQKFSKFAQTIYNKENEDKNSNSGSNRGGNRSSGGGGGAVLWGTDVGKVITPEVEEKPVQAITFHDVAGYWAEEQINQLASLDVVKGYPDGKFYPENAVTRAEFVKMLCQLFDLGTSADASFADVTADDWFAPFVGAAKAAGLVQGDEENCFNPNKTVSRQDAAVMLSRLLQLEGVDASAFSDSSSVSDYATAHVGALFAVGLINGMDDGSFQPLAKTTRAQAAVMLLNCKNWQGGADE